MSSDKIAVAVVGLGFGSGWVRVYRDHPDVTDVAICDTNEDLLNRAGDRDGIDARFTTLNALLDSGRYDAIHLLTPIPLHVEQTLAVLRSGRHCACAIPMAMNLDDVRAILDAQRESGKNYMLMETAVYSNAALYARQLHDSGELGQLQFLRCAHYQNMEGWPDYWYGLPPMYYSTHALGPALSVAGKPAERVFCLGSGELPSEFQGDYGNPYPIQTAIIRLRDSSVACEVTRCLFQMTRGFQERFDVYGDRMALEWPQLNGEEAVVYQMDEAPMKPGRRGRPNAERRATLPNFADRVPEALRGYIRDGASGNFMPHMVHEFVRSAIEGRAPSIDGATAANWTAIGICAHESSMRGGEGVDIPAFDE